MALGFENSRFNRYFVAIRGRKFFTIVNTLNLESFRSKVVTGMIPFFWNLEFGAWNLSLNHLRLLNVDILLRPVAFANRYVINFVHHIHTFYYPSERGEVAV